MGSFWLVLLMLLLFFKAQDKWHFPLGLRSACMRIMALAIAETRSYLLTATRLLLLLVLIHSILPYHIFASDPSDPSISTGILYYLWALLRVQCFVVLLSTCNFAPDRFSALPTELLYQIFNGAVADLHSLSLVSRRFNHVTNQILYKDIRLVKEPRRGRSHPLLLLMRTIVGMQGSQLVRSLELSSYQMSFDAGAHRTLLGILPGNEERSIAHLCSAFVLSHPFLVSRLAWSQALKAGSLDAFVHLLLVWLPNLNSISLQGYTWNIYNLLPLISPHIVLRSRFTQLTHLDLRCKVDLHERTAMRLNLQQFAQLLRIPSLRSLAVDMIELETILWPFIPMDPLWTSALTSLDVTLIHEQNLGKVLHLLPQPQKLNWTFWLNYKRPMSPSNLICRGLEQSLSACVNTLQELRIVPGHGFGRRWRNSKAVLQGTLDLSAFKSLHTLEVPFRMLLGKQEEDRVVLAQRLPRGLKHLILVDNLGLKHNSGRWTASSLLNVLRRFLIFPGQVKLKTLTSRIYIDPNWEGVVLRDQSAEWRKRVHAGLRPLCELVGVRFIGD